jgi:hypothetical protein
VSTERFAPRHLQRGIQEVCPRYFLDWNNRIERWEARAWTHFYWKPTVKKIEDWIRRAVSSYHIRRCFYSDEQGHDIGHRKLDYGFILDNKIGVWNTNRAMALLREIDARNQMIEDAANSQEDYEHRAAAKAIYKHFREPSVYLGGK